MKIIIAGDYSPKYRLYSLIKEKKYNNVFGNVKEIITTSDLAIVNFESVIEDKNQKPITKIGSCLSCHSNSMEALKWAGFNIITLANNHCLDYGGAGLNKTIECAQFNQIDTVGAGMNLDQAKKVLYKKFDLQTIAVINCCEHEFSIANEFCAGSNPLDVVEQYNAIQEAKKKADYIIVIVHGGHEHFQLPSLRMQKTYRFFIDAGADVVLNHHQHCFSGYEIYEGKPIFYGLGNFCFDEKNHIDKDLWIHGYMVELEVIDKQTEFTLYPYIQCADTPGIFLNPDFQSFDVRLKELNQIISDPVSLKEKLAEYYSLNSRNILAVLEPYRSRISKSLFSRKLLPSQIDSNKALRILNKISCESHLDKLRFAVSKRAFK